MPAALPSRLYAILDVDATEAAGLRPEALLDAWLDAGIRLVQLRAKRLATGPMTALADRLARPMLAAGGWFVVNDRADVARMCRATGVHLGQDDLGPADARRVLLTGQRVGVSTHSAAQVSAAVSDPDALPDYVALGPVFPTRTKVDPDPVVGVDGVRAAAETMRQCRRPLVAIGGIDIDAAPAVIQAGADAVAVVSGLLAGGHARATARAWLDRLGR